MGKKRATGQYEQYEPIRYQHRGDPNFLDLIDRIIDKGINMDAADRLMLPNSKKVRIQAEFSCVFCEMAPERRIA